MQEVRKAEPSGLLADIASRMSLAGVPAPLAQLSIGNGREYLSKYHGDLLPSGVVEALRGKPLLDLGCGRAFGYMAQFARYVGASEYFGVDLATRAVDRYTPEGMRIRVQRGEILEHLQRLPDASVNVTINAIDSFIVHDLRWVLSVADQIGRVTLVGGVVSGINALPIACLRGRFQASRGEEIAERMGSNPSWQVLRGYWHDPCASLDLLSFGIVKKLAA